jgi:hypothetical protein
MSQRPAATGLLVCEQVIIEEGTKNVTPVNCFLRRKVKQFPTEGLNFFVFGILNGGNGDIRLDAKIQRLDTLEEILERSASFRFRDQLQEVYCMFRFRECSFPVAGGYEALLFADNELIAQRTFRLIQKEEL